MHLSPPPPQPEITRQSAPPELVLRLPFEIGQRAFGRSWAIRAEILAQTDTGKPTLYRIAADYGVSRQYVGRLAQRVKKLRGT